MFTRRDVLGATLALGYTVPALAENKPLLVMSSYAG